MNLKNVYLICLSVTFCISIGDLRAEIRGVPSFMVEPEVSHMPSSLNIKSELSIGDYYSDSSKSVSVRKKNKAVAVTLAVTLGVFGVHRLYLGTSNKVPIIYTLTFGGGFGVLMVSDIVAILATKDINTFSPSEKVFMWAK